MPTVVGRFSFTVMAFDRWAALQEEYVGIVGQSQVSWDLQTRLGASGLFRNSWAQNCFQHTLLVLTLLVDLICWFQTLFRH